MRNLAISGKFGTGKDSLADAIGKTLETKRLSIAGPLKELCKAIRKDDGMPLSYDAGWAHAYGGLQWNDYLTMAAEIPFQDKDRKLLVAVGSAMRKKNPDVFIETLIDLHAVTMAGELPCIITDVRFPNEAEKLSRLGFLLVRLERDKAKVIHSYKALYGIEPTEEQFNDISETALDGFDGFDLIVEDCSYEELCNDVAPCVIRLMTSPHSTVRMVADAPQRLWTPGYRT